MSGMERDHFDSQNDMLRLNSNALPNPKRARNTGSGGDPTWLSVPGVPCARTTAQIGRCLGLFPA